VETTVTTIVSGRNTPAESCATSVTRPAASPHSSTDAADELGGIWVFLSAAPGHPVATRAIIVSLDVSNTVITPGSVRLRVSGTDTLPPLPTASESKPHWSSAGGAGTTATSTESLNVPVESAS